MTQISEFIEYFSKFLKYLRYSAIRGIRDKEQRVASLVVTVYDTVILPEQSARITVSTKSSKLTGVRL